MGTTRTTPGATLEPTLDTTRGTRSSATARADLHCHSRYSDRSDEWVLRAVSAPESVMEPSEVYRLARRRGMDFVTISDHDRIEGALEIAHLPGTFVSCEVTVAFPEDGCQIHCLVSGISEAQHRELQRRRDDLYAFRRYALAEAIPCTVAHPFYRVNGMLDLDHMEKLILLFDRFEARNGIHDGGGNELVEALFARLTRGEVLRMAERQDLAPVGERPWVKHLTGGSDDHGGFYVGTTWTETPAAADVGTFLANLAAGATVPGGAAGSTPRLTQSIYGIADGYAKQRLGASRDPFRATLARLGLPEGERPRRVLAFFRRGRGASGAGGGGGPRRPPAPEVTLRRADRTVRKGVRRFLFHSALQMRRGNLAGGLASLAHLAPAAAALVPFLFALHAQHKDSVFLRKARRHFTGEDPDNGRKVWVTDTFGDVNGVARTVETVGRLAVEQGRELKVLTCRSSFEAPGVDLVNFKPLVAFPLPGYKNQLISVPPAVEIYHRLEELKPDEIIISTPGPVGLVALSAARLLGIRVSGIYHTDFPAYLRHLIGPSLEDPTWAIMRWFYGGMERVYVRSLVYRELLLENGFAADQVRLMPRAVDTALFRPGHRDPGFWARHGGASADADGGPVFRFVYVGRVSKEKNLDALFESFDRFLATGRRAELAVVGDGPYLEELRERFAERRDVLFTGVLRGEELAAAYASGDLFVFPSLTDTLGNAVLEAQASGLAAVVTHRGGPKELVRDGISGLVVDVSEDDAFRDAMIKLYDDPDLRAAMGKQGVEGTRRLSWDVFLADLWRETPADDEAAQRPAGPSRVASIG